MNLTIGEIADLLDGDVVGDKTLPISHLAELQNAPPGSISFLANPKYLKFLKTTQASAIIVDEALDVSPFNQSFIQVKNPYESFTLLLETYERLTNIDKIGIEQPHYQGENVNIGVKPYIGAFAYIGSNVTIGNHVKIHPQVHIGDGCSIDDHCIIYPGVKIYPNTIIGKYCKLQAGAVIGSHGFGFAPT
ncbi:MAG: LpxD N-terminal domain-containing protein, partial [Marinoscillum sp.]